LLTAVVQAEMDADEVTDPPAGVPWVETVIGPESKMWAGPYTRSSEGMVAVTGVAEPPEGRVTWGFGQGVVVGLPHAVAGPPKRPMRL
jgi:hypothetical protein